MHKTYKNGIFTGNTVRTNKFNTKTTRNFIFVNDMKIHLNKLSTEPKIYSKKYKDYENDVSDNDENSDYDDYE
jgi:hypothetical protein